MNICPIKDVESYIVDIRNEKDIKSALQEIKEIDILINNAGVYDLVDINNGNCDDVDKIVDTNLKGTYLITKNILPLIRKSKGSIVFVSSGIGVNVDPTSPIYCATKAGINMLAKCLALSESKYGVKVNTVLPGPIDTPLIRKSFPNKKDLENYLNLNPNKRLGSPVEVANAILYLSGALDERNNYIVGAFLSVDGGESISSNLPQNKNHISDETLEERVNNYIQKNMLDFDKHLNLILLFFELPEIKFLHYFD